MVVLLSSGPPPEILDPRCSPDFFWNLLSSTTFLRNRLPARPGRALPFQGSLFFSLRSSLHASPLAGFFLPPSSSSSSSFYVSMLSFFVSRFVPHRFLRFSLSGRGRFPRPLHSPDSRRFFQSTFLFPLFANRVFRRASLFSPPFAEFSGFFFSLFQQLVNLTPSFILAPLLAANQLGGPPPSSWVRPFVRFPRALLNPRSSPSSRAVIFLGRTYDLLSRSTCPV